MGMLKEEPKLLHLYEEITSNHYGEIIMIEGENPDERKYKSIGTFRRAFVGDMQEKLNEIYGENIMKSWVKNPNTPTRCITKKEYIYIQVTVFHYIWIRIKKYFQNIRGRIGKKKLFVTIFKKERVYDYTLEEWLNSKL